MHMCVCMHTDTRGPCWMSFLIPFNLIFLRQDLSLSLELTVSLDWLASELQGSMCLYLVSTGIAGTTTWVSHRSWGPELSPLGLGGRHFTHRGISQTPLNFIATQEIIVLLYCLIIIHNSLTNPTNKCSRIRVLFSGNIIVQGLNYEGHRIPRNLVWKYNLPKWHVA